jgi:hypothetical protein
MILGGQLGSFPWKTSRRVPIFWNGEEQVCWGDLNGFVRDDFFDIGHGRRTRPPIFSDELRPCHGQCPLEILLSLSARSRSIPGSPPAGLASFPWHVEVPSNGPGQQLGSYNRTRAQGCPNSAASARNEPLLFQNRINS